MHTYTTFKDSWQLSVENRSQGWQLEVSRWTGEDFETLYAAYCIAESFFEAAFGALAKAGYPEDFIEWQLTEWEIFSPEDDD